MQMFLEIVEDGFDLGTKVQEVDLPQRGDLFLLLRERRRYDHDAVLLPHLRTHHRSTVVRVAYGKTCTFIQEQGLNLRVVDGSVGECDPRESAIKRDTCMQL